MSIVEKMRAIIPIWFWRTLPRALGGLSSAVSSVMKDGHYFSRAPILNIVAPLFVVALGFYSGVVDRADMPVYTANPLLLGGMLVLGMLSGYLGFLTFIGFVVGDLVFFTGYNFYDPHWAYPLAILAGWIFLWQLLIGMPLLVKAVTRLPDKFRSMQIVLIAPLTMFLVHLWTIMAMIVLRPMFLWDGHDVDMDLVQFGENEWALLGVHLHVFAWVAGGACLVRLVLETVFTRLFKENEQVLSRENNTFVMSQITMPWPLLKYWQAALLTLLLAGLFTKAWAAVLFGLLIGSLTITRSIISKHRLVALWDGWMKKIPALIRLIVSYAVALGVSWVLIGFLRDWMDWRTLSATAVIIVFTFALTLMFWPQKEELSAVLPEWISQRLPWLRKIIPAVLFGSITMSYTMAFAHHCSFEPGCECLTNNGVLANVIAGLTMLATAVMRVFDEVLGVSRAHAAAEAHAAAKPRIYPQDYSQEELDAHHKRLEKMEAGGVQRVYPEEWIVGAGAIGKAITTLLKKGLKKATKKFGDKTFTKQEHKELQDIANKYDTELEVYGSRARNQGRNINRQDLPVGKGQGTRSDIDVRIDGDIDIATKGRLSDDVSSVGNGAGSPRPKISGIRNDTPTIKIKPRK